MKKKLLSEGYAELSEKIGQLKLTSPDGKKYLTDCTNTETLFRIVQSIPSPKAEPFKRWLARVGYERIQEIENPELAMKRMRALYQAKGYSDSWIEKRVRGIAIREELTGEWKNRGVREGREYAILTAEISKAATTEITKNKDTQGYDQNRTAAKQGGEVAGKARKDLEAKSGKKVLSNKNYLQTKQNPALEK